MEGRKRTLSDSASSSSSSSSSEDDAPCFSMGGSPRKRSRLSIDVEDETEEVEKENGGSSGNQASDSIGAIDSSNYSVFAQRMLKKYGYEEGKGLGKYGQGVVAPVEASRQRGRRGLGLQLEGLDASANLEWDASQEHVDVEEEVSWLPHCPEPPPEYSLLSSWPCEGPKKLELADETNFCDPKILDGVLSAKSVFDVLDGREMQRSRARSNPFETLGKLFFQNRAAIKMANMDAVFDFMFTRPKNEAGESLVKPNELLYFADVCAAPGGFSEYVLWRRKTDCHGFCEAKGFGFTLKDNDFKLHDFFAAPVEFFEPYYGQNGLDGDGDIFKSDNVKNFVEFVRRTTGGLGVHFMMADGGFSVEGQENIQEILSKQLYLCQFLVALGIVRTDGHFVCKLFDVFTTFSVGLVYLMYRSFKYVSLHKPNTSRPANSERYIMCKWKRENTEDVYQFLFDMNIRLNSLQASAKSPEKQLDITELVPLEHIMADEDFYQYMCNSNNELGYRQIIGLRKIQTFCRDTQLVESRQSELRLQSLAHWKLPDQSRVAPQRSQPADKFSKLHGSEPFEYMARGPEDLLMSNLREKLRGSYDHRCLLLAGPKDGRKDRAFYLGLGGCNVFRWDGRGHPSWMRMDTRVELPPDTLVYGELVTEYRGDGRTQRKLTVLHLIDALVLNGKDVRTLHIVERHNYLKKFAMGVNKPSRPDLAPIRCKEMFRLEELSHILSKPKLHLRMMKGGSMLRRVWVELEGDSEKDTHYIIPTGLLFLKITQDPWMMAFSRSQNRKYWFNTRTRKSTFDCIAEVIAPFRFSYCGGMVWWWEKGVHVLEEEEKDGREEEGEGPACNKVHRSALLAHLAAHR
ncbi:hypothetical protein Pcinc_033526 [Petrolisthes cinctipes]|uniref:Cap-specific mRNA (nucleoside-2'-O-)-methyltransferase 1 n=1 Tax=Petrolisthes cinctipes TaxID=88211 RepID=A0AAE1ES39_PETCI|nr:hypothetical protein Pcinc_033526 [Petrolisthes cinctipes]